MAIVVTASGTVDDVDTTELNTLENHFQIISDGDPDTIYYDEGDNVLEEAAEGESMPSELLKLVKCIGADLDTDDVANPAGFVGIGADNAPTSEKVFLQ